MTHYTVLRPRVQSSWTDPGKGAYQARLDGQVRDVASTLFYALRHIIDNTILRKTERCQDGSKPTETTKPNCLQRTHMRGARLVRQSWRFRAALLSLLSPT